MVGVVKEVRVVVGWCQRWWVNMLVMVVVVVPILEVMVMSVVVVGGVCYSK